MLSDQRDVQRECSEKRWTVISRRFVEALVKQLQRDNPASAARTASEAAQLADRASKSNTICKLFVVFTQQ